MMKCLSVCDVLSSHSVLPSGESLVMLFCVANGNVDVIKMKLKKTKLENAKNIYHLF